MSEFGFPRFEPHIPLVPRPRRLVDFDDRYTAPLSGFTGVQQYYRQASSAPLLARIELPTLIITAADDPVIPVSLFRHTRLSRSTRLYVTEHGGHVGFMGIGGIDPDRRWLDWRIVQWIQRASWQPGK